jgi:hypothetical protein
MKERQWQNGMRRSALVPHKNAKQSDTGANERGLHQSNLSLSQTVKCPHQTAATGAGKKRTGKIESANAMSDGLVHSDDDEQAGHDRNRHVDQESPAP